MDLSQIAGQRLNMGGADAYIDHSDAIGSTTMETDPAGGVQWKIAYYPWGQILAQGGIRQSVVWAGLDWQVNDPSVPSATREYNDGLGRWLTPDPGGVKVVKLDDPQTWNMYAYVGNNPTSRVDPSGLCIEDACVVEAAIGLGVYSLTVATEEYLRSPAGKQATQDLGNLLIHAGQEVESRIQAGLSLAKQGMMARGEPPQLRAGKEAHNGEEVRPGEESEVSTPSGNGRMDRYDEEKAHIREIKPDNPRGEKSGQKQLERYKEEMERATGRPHTTELTKYPTQTSKPAECAPDKGEGCAGGGATFLMGH